MPCFNVDIVGGAKTGKTRLFMRLNFGLLGVLHRFGVRNQDCKLEAISLQDDSFVSWIVDQSGCDKKQVKNIKADYEIANKDLILFVLDPTQELSKQKNSLLVLCEKIQSSEKKPACLLVITKSDVPLDQKVISNHELVEFMQELVIPPAELFAVSSADGEEESREKLLVAMANHIIKLRHPSVRPIDLNEQASIDLEKLKNLKNDINEIFKRIYLCDWNWIKMFTQNNTQRAKDILSEIHKSPNIETIRAILETQVAMFQWDPLFRVDLSLNLPKSLTTIVDPPYADLTKSGCYRAIQSSLDAVRDAQLGLAPSLR